MQVEVQGRGDLLELCMHFHHEDRRVLLVPTYLSESEARFFTLTGGRRMDVEFVCSGGHTDLIYERYKFRRCQ